MKLNPQQIKSLSEEVVSELEKKRFLKLTVTPETAVSEVEQAVIADLKVEDRLNEEVKDLLQVYAREIEQGRVDYKTMFEMVKKKLVRERGLVL